MECGGQASDDEDTRVPNNTDIGFKLAKQRYVSRNYKVKNATISLT